MYFKIYKINIAITIVSKGKTTQPIEIFPATDHLTSFPPFKSPIPITPPTIACELETGTKGKAGKFKEIKKLLIPCDANKNKTIECDKTTTNADTGDSFSKSFPTVNITFFE